MASASLAEPTYADDQRLSVFQTEFTMSVRGLDGFRAKWVDTTVRNESGNVDQAASAKRSAMVALKAPFAAVALPLFSIPLAFNAATCSSGGILGKAWAFAREVGTNVVLGPTIAVLGAYNLFKAAGHTAAMYARSASDDSTRGVSVGLSKQ